MNTVSNLYSVRYCTEALGNLRKPMETIICTYPHLREQNHGGHWYQSKNEEEKLATDLKNTTVQIRDLLHLERRIQV